ncbi:hypothetical protein F2P79_009796 [Pimephales promelas]|nr:hypothetical protein F2P79_009796 [Pimephales promelas]
MTLHVVQGPLKIHSASTLRSQQVQSTPSQPLSSHWFVKIKTNVFEGWQTFHHTYSLDIAPKCSQSRTKPQKRKLYNLSDLVSLSSNLDQSASVSLKMSLLFSSAQTSAFSSLAFFIRKKSSDRIDAAHNEVDSNVNWLTWETEGVSCSKYNTTCPLIGCRIGWVCTSCRLGPLRAATQWRWFTCQPLRLSCP